MFKEEIPISDKYSVENKIKEISQDYKKYFLSNRKYTLLGTERRRDGVCFYSSFFSKSRLYYKVDASEDMLTLSFVKDFIFYLKAFTGLLIALIIGVLLFYDGIAFAKIVLQTALMLIETLWILIPIKLGFKKIKGFIADEVI